MHFFTNFGEDEQTSMLPLQENLAQAEAERRGHKGARAPHTKFGGHKWPCAPQSKLDEANFFELFLQKMTYLIIKHRFSYKKA